MAKNMFPWSDKLQAFPCETQQVWTIWKNKQDYGNSHYLPGSVIWFPTPEGVLHWLVPMEQFFGTCIVLNNNLGGIVQVIFCFVCITCATPIWVKPGHFPCIQWTQKIAAWRLHALLSTCWVSGGTEFYSGQACLIFCGRPIFCGKMDGV